MIPRPEDDITLYNSLPKTRAFLTTLGIDPSTQAEKRQAARHQERMEAYSIPSPVVHRKSPSDLAIERQRRDEQAASAEAAIRRPELAPAPAGTGLVPPA